MNKLKLNVYNRAKIGSSENKRLRKSGKIPAVIYGVSDNNNIYLEYNDIKTFKHIFNNQVCVVELINKCQKYEKIAFIKKVDKNFVTDSIIHIDFQEISKNNFINTQIPIKFIGDCYGVKNENGNINFSIRSISIKCLPEDLPEYISIDISNLKINESIHIKDLEKINNVIFEDNKDIAIVSCSKGIEAKENTNE